MTKRKAILFLVGLLTMTALIFVGVLIGKGLPAHKAGTDATETPSQPATETAEKPTQTATEQLPLPDLDAAYIERLPRYDYDAAKNQPAAGDAVTFTAHIANRGGGPSGSFDFLWKIDGQTAGSGTHPGLASGQTDTLSLGWTWAAGKHTVSIALDPAGSVAEVTDQNNTIEDATNAISLGLWAEQSVVDYFNTHQAELGLGSNSWEDWAQRQVRTWNQIFQDSVNPLTPNGVSERVRLDKVVIVPDGELPNPYPSNAPDPDDRTIDLEWGIPSEMVGVASTHPQYGAGYVDNPDGQNVDYGLLHELSHARYLDDLYAVNICVDLSSLSNAVGASDTTLVIAGEAGTAPFTVPAYLAVEQELIVCQNGSGHTFTDCKRGAEGTTPRPHPEGAVVNRAGVRLQDGAGNLVMGGPAMPLIGFNDHLYYNRYGDDVMNSGRLYLQQSAYAWERIAGQRPTCGNTNPPCNIGTYQNDSPEHNIFVIANGKSPLAGAKVAVYSARSDWPNGYNTETFLNSPDATYTANAQGEVDLGHFPFDPGTGTAAPYNRVIILKVTVGGNSTYHFVEISRFNEAYWAGWEDTAWYYLDTTTEQADLWVKPDSIESNPGETVTLRAVVGNYGAETAEAPTLSASFDPALKFVSAYPFQVSLGNGTVEWKTPALSKQQVGAVLLTLRVPEDYTGSTAQVNWQIGHPSEAFPQDNTAESTISISQKVDATLTPAAKTPTGEEQTLKIVGTIDDAEVGMIECATYSTCRGATESNFLLTGNGFGSVEASYDGGKYAIKRAFLYFDLSGVPAGATISEVSLHVHSGEGPAGNTTIHVVRTRAGNPPEPGDYSKVIFTSGGSAVFTASNWITIPIVPGALSWFQPGQVSRLALVNELDLLNHTPTGRNYIAVQFYEDGSNQPYLVVKYSQ